MAVADLNTQQTQPRMTYQISCALLACVLTACGGGGGSSDNTSLDPVAGGPPDEPPTGLWITSEPGDGLLAYRTKLTQTSSKRMAAVVDAAPTTEGADAGFSTTYTLESDIDEHDIVKYDGQLLAVAPSRSACCFILDDAREPLSADVAPEEPNSTAPAIRLFTTDPEAGTATFQSTIALDEAYRAEGLYLENQSLHLLLSTAWWGVFGSRHIEPEAWESQQVALNTYNVASPTDPTLETTLEIEGGLVSSRRQGSNIILVTRHTPQLEGLIAYPTTPEEIATNESVLAEATDDDILPTILIDGSPASPFTLDDCYRQDAEHPLASEMPADPIMTTILVISTETGDIVRSACAMESIDGVSVGQNFIALSFVRWDRDADETLIHLLAADSLEYLGSESVSGALYSGGNADFRINEFDGVLRLVTTQWTGDPEDQFRHMLFTLRPETSAPELAQLATLGGSDENRIGKKNEDLYGVRFKGSRAYLVTFERVDPLYVVDLSDPSAPRIAGELEVPGFSDLLHEVNSDLLLGLGSSENRLPKLELFDISDISNPVSKDLFEIGAGWDWAYSPAQYNRYAFTYLPGESVDRLTVPYAAASWGEKDYRHVDKIALFELIDKQTPQTASIRAVGEVTLAPDSVTGETRVIIDSGALYVIAHTDLLSGFWSNPEAMRSFSPK